ncbi:MAG: FliM/FliN family flagellar motor switch protein [Parvularculaceae bacterium]
MSQQPKKQEESQDEVEWADKKAGDDISELLGFDLSAETGVDRSGLKALINSALVSHRRLPMLDVIFDRAARMMTTSLRQLTNDNVEVALDDVTSTRFGDYIEGLSPPSVVGVVKCAALDNYCLMSADSQLVYSVVDLLLGGRRGGGVLAADDRGFTTIELALAQRVLSLLIEDFSHAFKPVIDAGFALDRVETTPRFAAIAQSASVCALAKFRIDVEERGGRVSILIPHAALEPVRKQLAREFIGESNDGDQAWRRHLTAEISTAPLELSVVLAEKDFTLKEVSAFKPGQTLTFDVSPRTPVDVRSSGSLLARGRIGRAGGRVAVRLEEPVANPLVQTGEER